MIEFAKSLDWEILALMSFFAVSVVAIYGAAIWAIIKVSRA